MYNMPVRHTDVDIMTGTPVGKIRPGKDLNFSEIFCLISEGFILLSSIRTARISVEVFCFKCN